MGTPGSSSPPRLDAVADRAEWMASRVSQLIPAEMLAEFGDEEREIVSRAIRAADHNRAKGALAFAAELREANVPDHTAIERLEDMGNVGEWELRKAVDREAVHIIESQEREDLTTRQAHYNALAISRVIDQIMRTHITGMILVALAEAPTHNTDLIKKIATLHKHTTHQLLGAVDYLNQGAKI